MLTTVQELYKSYLLEKCLYLKNIPNGITNLEAYQISLPN